MVGPIVALQAGRDRSLVSFLEQSRSSRTPDIARSSERSQPAPRSTVWDSLARSVPATASRQLRRFSARQRIKKLCASRHPSSLDEVARPLRPRNMLCSMLLDPRFVERLSEKNSPRVHPMVLHAVLLLLPEGSNRFLERKPCRRIASLAQVARSCRPPASSHHTRKQFSPKGQSTSQSNPKAGSLPKGRGWCRLDFEAFIHRRVRCDKAP